MHSREPMRWQLITLALGTLLLGGNANGSEIRIDAGPAREMYDRPIPVKITGLPSGALVRLRVLAKDASGSTWESSAVFTAAPDGSLDVSVHPSCGGTFVGVDALGPVWSMDPKGKAREFAIGGDFSITIQVATKGAEVARALERRVPLCGRDVRCEKIRTERLVGDLYLPAATGSYPGLILLGGSDGEPMSARAALLASRGFVVLNVFYFGHPGLPERFVGVPIEYLGSAVSWLKEHKEIDSRRIGVIGHSRGAEGAILLGTIREDIRAIVAVAPSAVAWPGPNPRDAFRSAWSYGNRDVPFVPIDLAQGFDLLLRKTRGTGPANDRPLFEASLKNADAVQKAEIPVEKSKAAVLLISGKDDGVWPAGSMAEMVVKRLDTHRYPYRYQHLNFEAAGHSFGLPNLPRPDNAAEGTHNGGTRKGNALAAAESWRATVMFLEKELAALSEKGR